MLRIGLLVGGAGLVLAGGASADIVPTLVETVGWGASPGPTIAQGVSANGE